MGKIVLLLMSFLVLGSCLGEHEEGNQHEISLISSTDNGCLKSIRVDDNLVESYSILCLSTGEKEVGSVEIYFDETLYTEIYISELSEY